MHVLIVPSEQWLPRDNQVAGIFQFHQAMALHRAGMRVGVIAPAPRSARVLTALFAAQRNWPADERVPFPALANRRAVLWPGRFQSGMQIWWNGYGRRMFRVYCERYGRPDIIHAHGVVFAGACCRELTRSTGVPYVITEHSSGFFTGAMRRSVVMADAYRHARARIMVSPFLGARVESVVGPEAVPWEYIPNLLDPVLEQTASLCDVPSTSVYRLLCIAQFVSVKNHIGLIRAFAKAFRNQPGVELRLGGSGPLMQAVREAAITFGVSNQVKFLGFLSRSQVFEEMQACSALVLPSFSETFGVVLIEAMAYGKPVVAPRGSGPDAIVNASNGLLFRSGDDLDLARMLAQMQSLSGQLVPSSIRLGCLQQFGEAAVVARLRAVYERVVTKPHAPAETFEDAKA